MGGAVDGHDDADPRLVAVSLRSIDAFPARSAGNGAWDTRALGTRENNGQLAFSHYSRAADNDGRETLVVGGVGWRGVA